MIIWCQKATLNSLNVEWFIDNNGFLEARGKCVVREYHMYHILLERIKQRESLTKSPKKVSLHLSFCLFFFSHQKRKNSVPCLLISSLFECFLQCCHCIYIYIVEWFIFQQRTWRHNDPSFHLWKTSEITT